MCETLTSTKEQRDQRQDHLFAKILLEEEEPQHDPDRHDAQDRHRVFDHLKDPSQLSNVGLVFLDQLRRENVRPEVVFAFAKRHLQFHRLLLMRVLVEEIKGMFEGRRSTLHAIVHPGRSVFLLVQRDRRCLSTRVTHPFDDRHLEAIGMLGQGSSTGLREYKPRPLHHTGRREN